MRHFLAKALYSRACRRLNRIKKVYRDPSSIQVATLKSIIKKQERTRWGEAHGYKDIKTVKQFQKRAPLNRYLDIKPWIQRCLEGEEDVLWPGRIKYFAVTSGTTAKNKYIPVTAEAVESNRKAALDCISIYLARTRNLSLFDGELLFLGGSTSLKQVRPGTCVGDLSGIMSKFVPFYLRDFYEPGEKIAAISGWETKIEMISRCFKDKDVRAVSGVPFWVQVLFNKILEASGKSDSVKEIWPNLCLFVHGGVDFRPYNKLFRKFLGEDCYFLETYPTSEGFIAVQDDPDEASLALMLDYGIFYEFVPADQVYERWKDRLTLEEAELGKNYAIVLTNSSGLASYILGDTVKLVSKKPPRIIVTGRIETFLNAFGEHVIVEELEGALTDACIKTGAEAIDYTVTPFFSQDPKQPSKHLWLIEFNKLPGNPAAFSRILDAVLREKNDDYKAHRSERLGIGRPQVINLARDTFYNWLKSEKKLGGQNKVPRIINDRDKIDRILAISH